MEVTTALYPLKNFYQIAQKPNIQRQDYKVSSTSYYPPVEIKPLSFKAPIVEGIDGKIFDFEGNLLGRNLEIVDQDRMIIIEDHQGKVVYCDVDTIALYNIITKRGRDLVNHLTKKPLTQDVYFHVGSYINSRIHTISFVEEKYVASLYGFYTTTYGSLLVSCLKIHSSQTKGEIDIFFRDGRSLFSTNLFKNIEREEMNITLESVNYSPSYDNFISYYFDTYGLDSEDLLEYVLNLIFTKNLEVNRKTLSQALEIDHPEILYIIRNQLVRYLSENDCVVTKDMVIKLVEHPHYKTSIKELKIPRDILEKLSKPYAVITSQEDYTHLLLIKMMS